MTNSSEINLPMQCWPLLAQYARTHSLAEGRLFYYDTGGAGRVGQENTASRAGTASARRPVLILVHGLGDEADSFRHIIPPLAQSGFRVIAPDLPGFGRSTGCSSESSTSHNTSIPWKGKISLLNHARAVIALMEEKGEVSAEKPAVLIGSSMGAMISQLIAAQRPELVKGIILIDGCHPLSGSFNLGLLLMALPFLGKKWYRNFRKNHEGAWKSLYPYYRDLDALSAEDKKFLRERVINRVESYCQECAYFSSLRSLINFSIFENKNFSRRMKFFTGKIHLLWGEKDRIIPFKQTTRFRSLHPGANFQLITGAGHLPHQETPAQTAQAIISWLANV